MLAIFVSNQMHFANAAKFIRWQIESKAKDCFYLAVFLATIYGPKTL